ncbi:MAG: S8 family serine peptidase [Eubacterium sp.]|nr:S8 family serine peptidase [Eubacterium sp.]
MKKRILTTMMSGLLAVSLFPASTFATTTDSEENTGDSLIEEGAEYVEGEVVVLYKDGKVTTEASGSGTPEVSDDFGKTMQSLTKSSTEKKEIKKELKNTLSDQKKILKKSLGGSYVVEDTIVFDDDNKKTDDLVTSVVSSEKYSTEELVEKLSENSAVEVAEPNYIFKATDTTAPTESLSDAYAATEQHLDDIHAEQLWDNYTASDSEDDVVVAVIDTGVDYTHEDLKDVMWTNDLAPSVLAGEHGYDFINNDAYPMDDNGHGSHCSGIIAAEADGVGIAGVASKSDAVKIMGVKVLDEEGGGNYSTILSGWYYVMQACANGVNVKAANCSLGGSAHIEIMANVIDELGETYGVVSCVAAGNETTNIDYTAMSPAEVNSEYALTVAATEESGNLASYSNYGEKNVDVAAPGTNIVSSVSYYNYMPYIYDDDQLETTTMIYGEFSDDDTATVVDDTNKTVTLDNVSNNVTAFGTGVVKTSTGSTDNVTLASTSAEEDILSGDTSTLKWTISSPTAGDEYLLVFPISDYSNVTTSAAANLLYNVDCSEDVNIEAGEFLYNASSENIECLEDEYGDHLLVQPSDKTMSDIWLNSNIGTSDSEATLYTQKEVSAASSDYDSVGIGIKVTACGTEDITVHLEDVAITNDSEELNANGDSVVVTSYGKYDLYSGTSMATPVVTGAVAMLAVCNPSASAADLCAMIRGNVDTSNNLQVSTGGSLDFTNYTSTTTEQAVITKAKVNTSKKTVTLTGKNFGDTAGSVSYYDMNAEDYDDSTSETIAIDSSDVSWSDSKIVISDSSLIGKNAQIILTTSDSNTVKYADYMVNGMTEFTDEGVISMLSSMDEWGDEVYSVPSMLTGSDTLRFYDSYGVIYQYGDLAEGVAYGDDYYDDDSYDEEGSSESSYTLEADPADALDSYDCESKWNLNERQVSGGVAIKKVLGVAYDKGIIYEVIQVNTCNTQHYLMVGYNTDTAKWKVYYDSYGKKTANIPFAQLSSTSMTVYNGYLYMLGGLSVVDEGTGDNPVSLDTIYAGQISKASSWTTSNMKVATMPDATYGGKVVAYNGNVYYALGQEDELISQKVYCYNISKKTCTTLLTLPDVIRDPVTTKNAEEGVYADYLQGTLGAYGSGLVVSGISFDGYGDLLYINPSKKTYSSAYATVNRDVIVSAVSGMTVGDKLYVGYEDYNAENDEEAVRLRSIDLSSSAYSGVNIKYAGLGSGSISGDAVYMKGETISGTIKANSKSYIKKVVIDGKTVKTGTAKSKLKSYTYSLTASKTTHTIKVNFGKYVSKVKFTKKKKTIKAGKSFKFKATTNGTNKNVKWKVSNKKYAKITSKGKFTAKKKGKGKTVKVTAISKENSSYKKTVKVKIK